MARPRSDDKRNAILFAATQVFAERGLGAPTSAISVAAGVAEGTLFIYFKTKDDLLNAVYREIKLELADAMMSGFPRKKSVHSKLQHIWDCFTRWGVANPEQCRVLTQLQISDRLTKESRAAGFAPFAEIETMAQDAISQHILREIPLEFISATMDTAAQTAMRFMTSDPANADTYRTLGFDMFWKGIIRK
jgi:AcrR family transcriptional regulator